MNLFIIDTIGPFFKGYNKHHYNWSKIPFDNLETKSNRLNQNKLKAIRKDFRRLLKRTSAIGFNAISIDDVAHLCLHSEYSHDLTRKICEYRRFYMELFSDAANLGMDVYVNTDIMFYNQYLETHIGNDIAKIIAFLKDAFLEIFQSFPQVKGIIFRIGETDGRDVKHDFRSKLTIKSINQTRTLLKELLPVFEQHDKLLIFRTWTVGAYQIGDLMWNRNTFRRVFSKITSSNLVVSIKYGESDFFSYLPLNKHFFRTSHKLIVELQSRREYEGFGEYPTFVGWDYEQYAKQLQELDNVIGLSVWCQTGGWTTFDRLTYLRQSSRWTEINTFVTIKIFKEQLSAEQALAVYHQNAMPTHDFNKLVIFFRLADEVIKELLYIDDFAREKVFFRRLRIPPLLAVYWDFIIINHSVRKILRCVVKNGASKINQGYMALKKITLMEDLAKELQLPLADIEFQYDTFKILAVAREYYFGYSPLAVREKLEELKKSYYKKYQKHYSVKLDFRSLSLSRRKIRILMSIFFRNKRGYRLFDSIFMITILSIFMPFLKYSSRRIVPDYLKDHAMGIDTLFK